MTAYSTANKDIRNDDVQMYCEPQPSIILIIFQIWEKARDNSFSSMGWIEERPKDSKRKEQQIH